MHKEIMVILVNKASQTGGAWQSFTISFASCERASSIQALESVKDDLMQKSPQEGQGQARAQGMTPGKQSAICQMCGLSGSDGSRMGYLFS